MSKSIEQQAAEIAFAALNQANFPSKGWSDVVSAALSRAGFLVSERDVLCRKLADAYFAYLKRYGYSPDVTAALTNPGPERDAIRDAVSAIHAYDREHAPKPRYVVIPVSAAAGSGTTHIVRRGDFTSAFEGTESECTAVAAALNALAEKEAGR